MFKLAIRNETLLALLQSLPKSKQWLFAKLDGLEALTDDTVVERVYRQVSNVDGITKQTHRGRFADLDTVSLRLCESHNLGRIHDVGVSSGITSVELYRLLEATGRLENFTVSDKYARYYRYPGNPGVCFADADHRLVAAYWGCIHADSAVSGKYPLSQWLYRRAQTCTVPQNCESFLLYHPELLRLIRANQVKQIDFDILAPLDGATQKYDYIRCMNLLNRSYFDEADLLAGLGNLVATLDENGVLQVGRSDESEGNNVSFFQRKGDRLDLVEQVRSGTEIADIIQRFNDTPSTPGYADSA